MLTPGIVSVSTAGHGGIWISPERLREMPRALRLGRQRWFEEDAEAALVYLAFADDIGLCEEDRKIVARSVADWHPDQWEAFFGSRLQPGESHERDRQAFQAATANRMVVYAVERADERDDVPAGMVGVYARRRADGAEGQFLVPVDRYRQRGPFGYVVDESTDLVLTPKETAAN